MYGSVRLHINLEPVCAKVVPDLNPSSLLDLHSLQDLSIIKWSDSENWFQICYNQTRPICLCSVCSIMANTLPARSVALTFLHHPAIYREHIHLLLLPIQRLQQPDLPSAVVKPKYMIYKIEMETVRKPHKSADQKSQTVCVTAYFNHSTIM